MWVEVVVAVHSRAHLLLLPLINKVGRGWELFRRRVCFVVLEGDKDTSQALVVVNGGFIAPSSCGILQLGM